MDKASVSVAEAEPADPDRVAGILALAFQEDPPLRWQVPDPDRRRALSPPLFRVVTAAYLKVGEVHLTTDGAGAALWALPGADLNLEELGSQFAELLEADELERIATTAACMDGSRPTTPCWYLASMGVVPSRQGRGVGGVLLSHVLHRMDASGDPAYTEASSQASRRFYERHGFETLHEVALPGGPSMWAMWREPATRRTIWERHVVHPRPAGSDLGEHG